MKAVCSLLCKFFRRIVYDSDMRLSGKRYESVGILKYEKVCLTRLSRIGLGEIFFGLRKKICSYQIF